MTILARILAEKEKEVVQLRQSSFKQNLLTEKKPTLFSQLKASKELQVIAEIKRASPSKGLIRGDVNPVAQALQYEKGGAACISVLTDAKFFKGSFEDLTAVAQAVRLPVLCKDFIINSIQIDRAYAAGASVVLLIVSALPEEKLKILHEYAVTLGLEVLVEVHDVQELEQALRVGAKLIGVNNRNLKTFEVDLQNTAEIAARFPFHEDRVLISESGIIDALDAETVGRVGARGILVGESLMREQDVVKALSTLKVSLNEVIV